MPALGAALPFRTDSYDKPVEDGGVLTDAASVTLTVSLPDGTTATPTITNPSTGKYAADYQTTSASPAGRYVGSWLLTYSGGATAPYVETFDVGPSLVTEDEALAHLRAAGVISEYDDLDQLYWLCLVATDAVERDLDRILVKRSVTESFDGGRGTILLDSTPVVSITTVVEDDVTLTADSDYVVHAKHGILYRGSSTSRWCWSDGIQNVTVTYVAGYNNPPSVARKVCLNAVQGMWQTSQQAPHEFLDAEVAVATASGALTQLERQSYNSLRSPELA